VKGANLGLKQRRGVAAVLAEPTLDDAARAAGVATRTLRRWRAEPAFAQALEAAAGEAFDEALARVRGIAGAAVETLREVMTDPAAPASARVSAARCVLERADRDAPRPEAEAPSVDSEAAAAARLAASLDSDTLRELDALAARLAARVQ
jgi:hypothetical protein